MIKETYDAVRVAEMEAEKQVSIAQTNADDKKNQIKNEALKYKEQQLKDAKNKAEYHMTKTREECEELKKERIDDINKEVTKLRTSASEKSEAGIKAIIEALV